MVAERMSDLTTHDIDRSVLMMLAPKRVDPHEAETAGTIMVLFLVSGLAAGAISGWLWLL